MATVNGTGNSDFIHLTTDGLPAPGGRTDIPQATDDSDVINSGLGGSDIIIAGGGHDSIHFAADLDGSDKIDGGAGFDSLIIHDQVFVTFGAQSLIGIEQILIPFIPIPSGTFGSVSLTMNDANVIAGQELTVDAFDLSSDVDFSFDGSDETDGAFYVIGGAGIDAITGGAKADYFDLSAGGNDSVTSGGNTDTFYFRDALTAADTVTGSASGTGKLILQGTSYASGLVFSATTIRNITQIELNSDPDGSATYNLTTHDANIAAGALLNVNATFLEEDEALIFNGAAETNGRFVFIGGNGDDVLIGGARADTFDLFASSGIFGGSGHGGGADSASGGAGNDTFLGILPDTTIDGGLGTDTAEIRTSLSVFSYVFGPNTFHSIEKLIVRGALYTMDDGNIAAGKTLIVQGPPGKFDGSAETDGHYRFIQTAGDGSWIGGALSDRFDIAAGSRVVVSGGGGNDVINAGANFDLFDTIDGGSGIDTLNLNGDYSAGVAFSPEILTNVEKIVVAAGHSYRLITDDATVAPGAALTVTAAALGAGERLIFNGKAETDGAFTLIGGAGNDILKGGALADELRGGDGKNQLSGGGGGDTVWAGAGQDTFEFAQVRHSTSTHYDRLHSADLSVDRFDIPGGAGTITGIDAKLQTGTLSTVGFNNHLTQELDGHLQANHATLFKPDAGTLANRTFLIVDLNGEDGYQTGQDLVVQLFGTTGQLTASDFI